MFSRPTVFVLGAGASWHYGYPTGPELIDQVAAYGSSFFSSSKKFFEECKKHRLLSASNAHQFLPRYILDKMQGDPDALLFALEETISECDALTERINQVDPLVIDYF